MLFREIERITAAVNTSDYASLELAHSELREIFPPEDLPSVEEMAELGDELTDELLDRAEDRYEQMEQTIGEENMRKVEHWLLLEAIDTHWREHLTAIEELRQSIGLQAYAQVDPLVAFKREGHDMYQQLVQNIRRQVARTIFKVRIVQQPAPEAAAADGAGRPAERPAAAAAPAIPARPSGPSPEQIRTLGAAPQPGGKGSSAARRRKLIR
jgi:preprotein translocase subunit SecA